MIRTLVWVCAATTVLAAEGEPRPAVGRRDVTFVSDGLRLAGTLAFPPRAQRSPGIVLVHGSGRADRSSMSGWAEGLARAGMVALAYDKRGVGSSEGPEEAWRRFHFDDLAGDAASAMAFLRQQPEVDGQQVGILGASQGGWVAPLAARQDGRAAFMIVVSGSVTTVAEDNLFERSARLAREGFPPDQVAEARAMHEVDLQVSRDGTRFDEFQALWRLNQDRPWFRRVYLDEQPSPPDSAYRLWYRTVMDFDPVPVLRELQVPAVWLYGDPGRDTMTPVAASVDILQELKAAGKPYELHVFAGADHSLSLESGEMAPFVEPLQRWLASVAAGAISRSSAAARR